MTNPFSTKFVRPGALPYQLSENGSLEPIVSRIRAADWFGEIIGPHGSGKSTLVSAICRELENEKKIVRFLIRQGDKKAVAFQELRSQILNQPTGTLFVVDGIEQLGWIQRKRIVWLCRRKKIGLLVTAHRSIGLPDIHHTRTSLETFRGIVGKLTANHCGLISEQDIKTVYDRHQPDIREALFELYDVHENRAQSSLDQA